jgi:hypothetical protein
MRVYIEPRDWWIGYYRGDTHHYVCPLPTVVFRTRSGVTAGVVASAAVLAGVAVVVAVRRRVA